MDKRIHFLLFLFIIPIVYAQDPVIVTVDAPSTISSDFDITLNVEDVIDLDAFSFQLLYDDDVVKLVGAEEGALYSSANVLFNEEFDRIVINLPGLAGVNGSGSLAVLNFEIVGSPEDSTDIQIIYLTMGDINAENILIENISPNPVTVTIKGGSTSPADTEGPMVTVDKNNSDIVSEDETEIDDEIPEQVEKKSNILMYTLLLILLIIGAGAGYWYYKNKGMGGVAASSTKSPSNAFGGFNA